jgi:apolipoprotein N-acyltransferase
MSGKFGRFLGMALVMFLVVMAGGFLVYVLDDLARRGSEVALLGLAGLAGMSWLVFRGPVGKALASMLEGSSGGEDPMLASRVADLEDRLQELSLETQRFLEIEERLEFTERLLAQHTDPARRLEG